MFSSFAGYISAVVRPDMDSQSVSAAPSAADCQQDMPQMFMDNHEVTDSSMDVSQGAKPKKIIKKNKTNGRVSEANQNKEDSLKKWKAAGIALRHALARIEKRKSDSYEPEDDVERNTQKDMVANGESSSSHPINISPVNVTDSSSMWSCFKDNDVSSNDMNSLLDDSKENVCDNSSLETAEASSLSKPLYKRTSSHQLCGANGEPGSVCVSESNENKACEQDTILNSGESLNGGGDNLVFTVDRLTENPDKLHTNNSGDSTRVSHPRNKRSNPVTSTFHIPRVPCSKLSRHKNRHRSKLPVPVKQTMQNKIGKSHSDKMDKTTKRTSLGDIAKSKQVVCRRKSKPNVKEEPLILSSCAVHASSSSEDEFGPADATPVVVEEKQKPPPNSASSYLMTADSVANLAGKSTR